MTSQYTRLRDYLLREQLDRERIALERLENAQREERLRPINLLVQRLRHEVDRADSLKLTNTLIELCKQPKELLREHGIYSVLERLAEHLDKKGHDNGTQ
jgi:hypothetical protein